MEKEQKRGFKAFWRGRGKLLILLGGALLGILFLLFGGRPAKTAETVGTDDTKARVEALEAYRESLQKELELLCEAADGVSDVRVLVTLSGGYTAHYVADGDGKTVTVGSGSGETALLSHLSPPAVAGVGIVCRGGSDPEVQRTLTELIASALGIPRNRVYITGK